MKIKTALVNFQKSQIECIVLTNWVDRLRGLSLLPSNSYGAKSAVLFPNCLSVHTITMKRPIDICFINSTTKQVVASKKQVYPGRILWESKADIALERFSSNEPWPLQGEKVAIVYY